MMLILAGLLGILAWTSLRGKGAAEAWDDGRNGLWLEQEAPMAAPPSAMFAEPRAQPPAAEPL